MDWPVLFEGAKALALLLTPILTAWAVWQTTRTHRLVNSRIDEFKADLLRLGVLREAEAFRAGADHERLSAPIITAAAAATVLDDAATRAANLVSDTARNIEGKST